MKIELFNNEHRNRYANFCARWGLARGNSTPPINRAVVQQSYVSMFATLTSNDNKFGYNTPTAPIGFSMSTNLYFKNTAECTFESVIYPSINLIKRCFPATSGDGTENAYDSQGVIVPISIPSNNATPVR